MFSFGEPLPVVVHNDSRDQVSFCLVSPFKKIQVRAKGCYIRYNSPCTVDFVCYGKQLIISLLFSIATSVLSESNPMSGHNKWSKVKHIKGAADAKRSKLFSKLAKEISVAARDGGGDPELNARLRQAITNAKKQSLPGETIDRAVKKGTGEIEGVAYEEACYEGFGAGGVAMIVEVITDNTNRVVADLRNIFNKNNGRIGNSGSVLYLFDRKGEIKLPHGADDDVLLEKAMDAGAEDMASDGEGYVVITRHDQLAAVASSLLQAEVDIDSQQLVYMPQSVQEITDISIARQVLRLFSALEDYDDTQNVFANFDIADELMEQVEL
jgi:YebC/PmpR family DNA-binding regulatory protein